MMTYSFLLIGLLLFGIWWLYFVEYRNYQIDQTRQLLFTIRDDLFDKASKGIVSFEDPAYGITRTTLNGMIQYTHELCLTRLLISASLRKFHKPNKLAVEYRDLMINSISNLETQAAKKAVLEAQKDMHAVMIRHVVKHSIFLWGAFELMILVIKAFGKLSKVKRDYVIGEGGINTWSAVDAEANQLGHQRC